ncbi:peptidase [Actinoplanes sp. ATCC 53533]|uniref:S8 family serine peptidase n=1 Tax=Actinoplanes sp. ATCC 53533 TaxID=1288362 RepID=UPI000F7A3E6F|nr:S8 family serine peptidase [Actinoplanes sp. ATCC 53533]RSM49994.1 peptidase [Actinoplanes sp. ATCC 53533]
MTGVRRVLLALLLVAAGAAVPARPAAAAPGPGLAPEVARVLAGGRRADLVVALKERADLSGARTRQTHGQRTGYGRQRLVEVAERSQRGLRDLLTARGLRHRSLWIVNAIHVSGADAKLAAELAARPDVRSVTPARTYALPEPAPRPAAAVAAAADGVEWNVSSTGADQVWSRYGVRGEGIVVASIDSGVQYDHPALVEQYRGNHGDGTFDHTYNWYDPYAQCGLDVGPCDTNGHGTHTMGTMVGDDGDGNRTGVAPGARWIATRGCQGNGCAILALLLAAQWIVAPFDENWSNPRPELAPHVVNNSWGAAYSDPFYTEAVDRWVQMGIMPVFAAGNDGPSCGTIGSPADYPTTYAVAAYDSAGAIADFSGRGSTSSSLVKPDIAAPGVAVRSSLPGNRYESYSGTSMATPHVAGAVALLWSAAPSLIGNVAGTRALLDDSAVDVQDGTCGGTTDDNRVWGEGKLDILAAVGRAPLGPFGTVSGTISSGGAGVAGARLRLVGANRVERVAITDANGRYSARLPVGSYQITASSFGYASASAGPVAVAADTTVTVDLAMAELARHSVSGLVLDTNNVPAAGITLQLLRTPLAAVTTGTDGAYRLDGVPAGTYPLSFGAGRCLTAGSRQVTVDGDEVVDVRPSARVDAAGYHCHGVTTPYVGGTAVLPLAGDDESLEIALPFEMPFYGARYTKAWVATNGFLTFDRAADNSINREVPNSSYPNAAVFAFWDDLIVDAAASVRTATLGTAPDRRFVVEWRNVAFYDAPGRATFAAELSEHGAVTIHFGQLSADPAARGAGATIGIENLPATTGLEYARDARVLSPGSAVAFRTSATLRGTVTKPDGSAAAGATVRVRAGDAPAIATTTAADGTYVLHLPLGTFTFEASLVTFGLYRTTLTLDTDGATVVQDVRLAFNERTVSGVVRDDLGAPVEGAVVRLVLMGTSGYLTFPRTGPDGAYRFEKVPETDVTAVLSADVPKCMRDGREYIDEILGGDVTRDITVISPGGVVDGADGYGYQCRVTAANQVTAGTPLDVPAIGPTAAVALPFAFPYYGHTYSTAYVATHGYLTFEPQDWQITSNESLPADNGGSPDTAIYAFWDDLTIDAAAGVRTGTSGTAPNRRFTVAWQDVLISDTATRISFDIVLHENGRIAVEYQSLPDDPRARGSSATVGLEGQEDRYANEYWYYASDNIETGLLRPGGAITYAPPGTISGRVTASGTGGPVAGATVQLLRLDDVEEEVTTDATGTYAVRVPLGSYTLAVTHADHYPSGTTPVVADTPYATVTRDVALTPR